MKSKKPNLRSLTTVDLFDLHNDEAFNSVIDEYDIMESHIIYFSAGDSRIKDILIKKDPSFSV